MSFVGKNLSPESIEMLTNLYEHYHKKCQTHKESWKHYKRLNLFLSLSSIFLTSTGVVVGGVTLNQIVLGTISGTGVLLHGFTKMKNYDRKIEMFRFAWSSYQKMLNKIKSFLPGEEFSAEKLVEELAWLDDQICDLCS